MHRARLLQQDFYQVAHAGLAAPQHILRRGSAAATLHYYFCPGLSTGLLTYQLLLHLRHRLLHHRYSLLHLPAYTLIERRRKREPITLVYPIWVDNIQHLASYNRAKLRNAVFQHVCRILLTF